MSTESAFTKLAAINVNKYVEKKGELSYLSWAWAVDQLFRCDPDAKWEYGEPKLYGETMMLFCTVTAFGKTRTAQLPVMDHRNKPIANPDAFQVNTAMQRCLVKAIALHGLGLYIYAGEDVPAAEREQVDEKLEAVLQELRAAAMNGIKALEAQWKALPEQARTALREQLGSLKDAAKKADAEKEGAHA